MSFTTVNNLLLAEIAKRELKGANWLKTGELDKLIGRSLQEQRAGQILWMFINIEKFRKLYFNKKWVW